MDGAGLGSVWEGSRETGEDRGGLGRGNDDDLAVDAEPLRLGHWWTTANAVRSAGSNR